MSQRTEKKTDSLPQPLGGTMTALLENGVPGLCGPVSISPLAGGRSNPTFLLDAANGRYVLRSRPVGVTFPWAHRIDREVRILTALEGSDIPVPPVLLHVDDPSHFGAPFYLMPLIDGAAEEDPALPALSPGQRASAYEQAIDILARLHRLSPGAIGLAGFGSSGDYNHRQLMRWSEQVAADGIVPPALLELGSLLSRILPSQSRTSIVHGDYRFGNLLLADGRVTAVLDWELSTLGDPFADLAYFLLAFELPHDNPILPGLAGRSRSGSGIPAPTALVERYCRATGFALPAAWQAYRAFALYRTAAIAHGVLHRNATGAIAPAMLRQLDDIAEAGLACLGLAPPAKG